MSWGRMDPNSAHQEWSYWRFEIRETGRRVPKADVEYNAARWLRMGFGEVGQARVTRTRLGWRIEARVEGESAADEKYVASVRGAFLEFVRKGWGLGAVGTLAEARVLAGDVAEGPRAQLIVMPTIRAE